MKICRDNIYLGTIKKCIDAYSFERFGEVRYVGNFYTKKYSDGVKEKYARVEQNNALLLKGKNDNYININDINSLKDFILFKLGKSHKIMKIAPHKDDELFVDKRSLRHYFNNNNRYEKVKFKTLKKELY